MRSRACTVRLMYATVHSNGDFSRLLHVYLAKLGLRLTTEGFFLRNNGTRHNNISKRNASFLLTLNPTKVGEFLGLPREAFDERTSLSTARAFELVVENRFFDGAAMAAWAGCGNSNVKCRTTRPMMAKFREWWQSTGMSLYRDRKPPRNCCNYEEACALAVDFFDARPRWLEWKEKGIKHQVDLEAGQRKECKRLLNFALVRSWHPDFSNVFIGELLRKICADHRQSGLVEFHDWLRNMSPEDLRNEVLAVARQLSRSRV